MYAALVRTQAQLTQVNRRKGKEEFRLIDPKTMIPEKLGKNPWRQWDEDTRAYVAMFSPTLAQQLKKVEGRPSSPKQISRQRWCPSTTPTK